jgi:Inhibitor of growth proteins N-terminal histone-binding
VCVAEADSSFALAGVRELPAELQRAFKLMRELDEKAHDLQTAVDSACRAQLQKGVDQVCVCLRARVRASKKLR